MGVFRNLLGTSETTFRVGLAGPTLKRVSGTALSVRNTADSAYAALQTLKLQTFGDDLELNSGAAGAGADWLYTLRRPSAGMTGAVVLVLPPDLAPAVGQALSVASVAGGVVSLGYATVPTGTDQVRSCTTTLAFGDASPKAMDNIPINAQIINVRVIIDTAFNGAPSLSIGITGTPSKYMPATAVDLTAAAGTIFEYAPGTAPAGGAESIIGTYAAGAASAGSARLQFEYVIPS
jgi:hypothetical protein